MCDVRYHYSILGGICCIQVWVCMPFSWFFSLSPLDIDGDVTQAYDTTRAVNAVVSNSGKRMDQRRPLRPLLIPDSIRPGPWHYLFANSSLHKQFPHCFKKKLTLLPSTIMFGLVHSISSCPMDCSDAKPCMHFPLTLLVSGSYTLQ